MQQEEKASIETYKLVWNNIEITIAYNPDRWKSYREVYGSGLGHLQIDSAAPLPITSTGFYSDYIRADIIEEWGGPVEYVMAWIVQAASSPEWQAYQEQSRQLTLF
jgi:hypothetical protein